MENRTSDLGQQILLTDKFYLLVFASGQFLKTRYKKDYDVVKSWDKGDLMFSGEVKNSQHLFFQVGSTILSKRISLLPVSRPQEETFWYDLNELNLRNGSHINKSWVGEKAQNYETL